MQTSPFTRSIHILLEAATDMISFSIHLYFFSQPFFLLLGGSIAILSAPNLGIRMCACDHPAPQTANISLIILVCTHCSMQGLVQSRKNFVYMDVFVSWLKSHPHSFKKIKRNKKTADLRSVTSTILLQSQDLNLSFLFFAQFSILVCLVEGFLLWGGLGEIFLIGHYYRLRDTVIQTLTD